MRLIATDGVFSMDGSIAKLGEICDLAERYGALVMVDDSHATGFIGARGRGTHELRGVMDRVDIMTGTLGKALGGASGGYVAARKEIVGWLRQRSRPYLFSNSIAAAGRGGDAAGARSAGGDRRSCATRVHANARYFRDADAELGLRPARPASTPSSPSCSARRRSRCGSPSACRHEGVYVVAFSYPVVPHGKARIRTQIERGAFDARSSTRRSRRSPRAGRELGIIQ